MEAWHRQIVRPYWRRLRYQLLSTLLLAAVVPYAVRVLTVASPALFFQLTQTAIASATAAAVGLWLFRSFNSFPGVAASSHILPAFSTAYALSLLTLLLGRFDYNRGLLLAGYLVSVVWSYLIYAQLQRQRRRIGFISRDTVVPLLGFRMIRWVDLTSPCPDAERVDAVVADLRADLPDSWERRLADYALRGVPVYHSKHLAESLTGRVELEHLTENNFGSLTPVSAYMSVKHSLDWLAALIALVTFSPLLAVLALWIRLDSPGPAIFRQTRTGYQGRPFTVWKFRTMTAQPAACPRDAAMTRPDDLRVTRPGRALRRTRLDELPQLINVLRGEMSWIGPRPEAEILSRWYESEIAFYRYRHIVRPGITGWAQVNQGHVAEIDEVRHKLHYDFFYIKHFSPWIDLLIVARTIGTMLTGFGSR